MTCTLESTEVMAVYKPRIGERPLWDFPDGLFAREAAAYELSAALGWELVPETVVRNDAPMGVGSLQRFVRSDFEQHYFSLIEKPDYHHALQMICTFDIVANNADRKSGHCLLGTDGQVWAIDNALCFHAAPKLRTVIWDFAGHRIPAQAVEGLERFTSSPPDALGSLLSDDEIGALLRRARIVGEVGRFPDPNPSLRPYPWPLL